MPLAMNPVAGNATRVVVCIVRAYGHDLRIGAFITILVRDTNATSTGYDETID